MKEIVFATTISKQGAMRVIVVPKKVHKQIKDLTGQVLIVVKELRNS